MRHSLIAMTLAGLAATGVAHAAPSFGSAGHRLGGSVTTSTRSESEPRSIIEALASFVGIEARASVEPIVTESYADRKPASKECNDADKTEVAKADSQSASDNSGAKGKAPKGEPVYLAF